MVAWDDGGGRTPIPAMPRMAIQAVDPTQCTEDIRTLAAFGTRSTLSDPVGEKRGIGAARRWIKEQFESYGKGETARHMQVSFESYMQKPGVQGRVPKETEVVNVVAVLPGNMAEAKDRRVYVVGHYDSRNGDGLDAVGDAPGANDDASGTTVVMECARILSQLPPLDATVVFLCTAGEEQGLLGARYHAEQAAARGEKIVAVLNNDIVGDPSAPEGVTPTAFGSKVIRLFSEGLPRSPNAEQLAEIRRLAGESDSPSRGLARYVAEVSRTYNTPVRPMLVFRADRFLRGGDHSAFNDAGFAAVRFTEVDEDYSRQHQNVTMKNGRPYGDVPAFVDADYLANVTRLNIATLVCLANAPSAPAKVRIVTAKLDNFTTLRWEKSPEPDAAGYEIVWRETTAPEWQQAKDVGNVTEATIELNKDDWFFGVRAYDREGYKSLVAFPKDAKE